MGFFLWPELLNYLFGIWIAQVDRGARLVARLWEQSLGWDGEYYVVYTCSYSPRYWCYTQWSIFHLRSDIKTLQNDNQKFSLFEWSSMWRNSTFDSRTRYAHALYYCNMASPLLPRSWGPTNIMGPSAIYFFGLTVFWKKNTQFHHSLSSEMKEEKKERKGGDLVCWHVMVALRRAAVGPYLLRLDLFSPHHWLEFVNTTKPRFFSPRTPWSTLS